MALPVKSMGAEALGETELSWHGLAGDRRWAFIRDGKQRSGFPGSRSASDRPWCTTGRGSRSRTNPTSPPPSCGRRPAPTSTSSIRSWQPSSVTGYA